MMLQKLGYVFFANCLLLLCCATSSLLAADPPNRILTSGEYTRFLNAVAATDTYSLYNEKMQSDAVDTCIVRMGDPGSYSYEVIPARAEDPVLYVSELSAKRYCNWIQNGELQGEQNEATTERGAYTLDGTMSDSPEKENNAACFLSLESTNDYAPSLASNAVHYSIILSTEESFSLPEQSSNEQDSSSWTTLDTVVGVIAVIAGGIAAYRYGACLPAEEEYQRNSMDSREQDTHVRFNAATASRSNAPFSLREATAPLTDVTPQQLTATTHVKYLELHHTHQDALTVKAANESRDNENPRCLLAWLQNIRDRLNAAEKDNFFAQARISPKSNRVFVGEDDDLPKATLQCIRNYYPNLDQEFSEIKKNFHNTEERLCWEFLNPAFAEMQFENFCDKLKKYNLLFDRSIWPAPRIIIEQNKLLSASWAQPQEEHQEAQEFVTANLRAACVHLSASHLVASWIKTALLQHVAPPICVTPLRKFRPDLNITTNLQNCLSLIEGADMNCSRSFSSPKSVTWLPGTPDNSPFPTNHPKPGMSAEEARSSKKGKTQATITRWVEQAETNYNAARNDLLSFSEIKRLAQEFLWKKQLSEKYFDRSLVMIWKDQAERNDWHHWVTGNDTIFKIAVTSGSLDDWEEPNTDSEGATPVVNPIIKSPTCRNLLLLETPEPCSLFPFPNIGCPVMPSANNQTTSQQANHDNGTSNN